MTKATVKESPAITVAIQSAVDNMDAEQFAAYEMAMRQTDYYNLSPADKLNYTAAIQAINRRRALQDRPFNVTITDGNRPGLLPTLPYGLQWAPLIAVAVVVLLASRL